VLAAEANYKILLACLFELNFIGHPSTATNVCNSTKRIQIDSLVESSSIIELSLEPTINNLHVYRQDHLYCQQKQQQQVL